MMILKTNNTYYAIEAAFFNDGDDFDEVRLSVVFKNSSDAKHYYKQTGGVLFRVDTDKSCRITGWAEIMSIEEAKSILHKNKTENETLSFLIDSFNK